MPRLLGSLALVAALLLTAGGCSDDAPDEPGPSSDGSSAGPPASPSAGESSASPTEPPTPSVTPAAGLRLRQGHLVVHVPEGWSKSPEPVLGSFSEQAVDDVLQSKLFIAELPDPAGGGPVDLDELARTAIRSGAYLRDPEILEPVELGGVEWYHTGGPIDSASYQDGFGTVAGGFQFTITLTTGIGILTPAERQDLLDSILASVELEL